MTRRELFAALGPVYLSVFLFVAGNSALTVLIPVYLARNGHLSTTAIGLVVGAVGLSATFSVLAVAPVVGALLMVRTTQVLAQPKEETVRPTVRLLGQMPLAVWVGVLVMFFINGLNALQNTFYPVLAIAAGLSLTQIGAASSLRSWASSSSRFGSGPLFQRFDPAGLTLPLVVLGTLATCAIPSVISTFALQVPLFLLTGSRP